MKKSRVVFPIVGMHCASCANLIERKLTKVKGVISGSVNYGSEQASLVVDEETVKVADIKSSVEELGYKAILESLTGNDLAASEKKREDEKSMALTRLKSNVVISLLIAPLVIVGSFAEMLGFEGNTLLMLLASPYLLLVLTAIIQFWAGREFYQSTWSALRVRSANMDTLIVVGTLAAFVYSAIITLLPGVTTSLGLPMIYYFDSSAVIVALVLLGRLLEMKAKLNTGSAIKKLIGLAPKTARVIRKGEETDIPIEEVVVGDLIRVRPGEKIPVDGVIIEGLGQIDESMITGEAITVDKTVGAKVIGATINKGGTFVFKATNIGEDSTLAKIVQMVSVAQGSRAPIQNLVDLISSKFVPLILILATATFVIWYVTAGFPFAFANAIAVLVIACPCAMGLAAPMAIVAGVGRAAEKGILVKNAESFELGKNVSAVIFDKTGTLTEGKPLVSKVETTKEGKMNESEILSVAATLEKGSEHALGEAILLAAKDKKIRSKKLENFTNYPGMGVGGEVEKVSYALGNARLMESLGVAIPESYTPRVLLRDGQTGIYLTTNKKLVGVILLTDKIKDSALPLVEKLRKLKIDTWMITGDNMYSAKLIAKKLGITNFLAEVLPHQKAEKVAEIKRKNQTGEVAFVGDGINDAPALATADIGIAMGSGSDIAIESAGVTLLTKNLESVVETFKLSKNVISTIKQNLFWAFGYNVILIPVAMGVLYPFFKILLSPELASLAMATSSISVVLNSLRIKRA